MRINRLYIKNFGGLSNFSMNFEPDFQVIYGANESGKTTIQQFIKVMFYGFGRNGRSIETNQRKKYMPWSGEQMGGTVVFTHQGIRYRLEKTFAEQKAQDQSTLLNDADGQTIILKNPEQPGFELFGISETEFVNTAFIESPGVDNIQLKDFEDKINRKVGLAEYDWSFDEIKNRLEQSKKYLLNKQGNRGYIYDLRRQRDELQIQIQQMLERDALISEINQSIEKIEDELIELEAKEHSLDLQTIQHQKLKIAENYQEYLKLARELKYREEQLNQENQLADNVLKNKSVTVKDLTEIAEQRQRLAYASSEYEIKSNLLKKRMIEQESFAKQIEQKKATILDETSRLQYLQKNTLQRQPVRVKSAKKISLISFVPLIILEAFFLLGGILLRSKAAGFSAFLIVLAVLLPFIMVGIYFFLEKKQETQVKKNQQMTREYEMRKIKIENELEELHWNLAHLEERKKRYAEDLAYIQSEVDQAYDISEREKKKLKYLIQPYFTALPNDDQLDIAIQTLREKTVDSVQLEEKNAALKARMEDLQGDFTTADFQAEYHRAQDWLIQHEHQLRAIPEYSEHYIAAQKNGVIERRLSLREDLATYKVRLEHLQADDINTSDLQRSLQLLNENLEKAEFNYYSLLLSLHMLEHSKMSFEQNIRPKLNEKAAKYLSEMTAAEYADLRIDQDYHIKLSESDETLKEQAYYSAGLNDQINLALRLALTELLQDETGKIPLILDDPLIQIDKERSLLTLKLLKKIGIEQKRQILLFTSQSSISKLLEDQGIKLYSL